ncbi:MAG: FecR domain-containing protein [Pseudomonadota bacterium]
MPKILACLAALVIALVSAPAAAQADPHVTYTVRNGDTLLSIAQRYLASTRSVERVRVLNGIAEPRRMPIGTRLKLPRALLRFDTVDLSVAAFSGAVNVAGQVPTAGAPLRENQVVVTGADGFVTFRTAFGGRISVPSNSQARLIRARRYVLGGMLDVDFAIERGRGSASSPTLKNGDELRLRTPRAVTAVRGTDFRVGYNPDAGLSVTEVVEGEVGVAAGKDKLTAPAGFGVASMGDGLGAPEALLPAPALADPGAIQTGERVEFGVTPAPEARQHRFQVARDAGFLDIVSEKVISGEQAAFEGLENGRYFVRARAVAASGVEGLSEAYSFRRKRIGTSASSGPSDLVDGFVFQWAPEGESNVTFAFQLWESAAPAQIIVDETGLETTAVVLTDLPSGTYEWRVAAIQPEAEGLLKVWGPAQRLTISE